MKDWMGFTDAVERYLISSLLAIEQFVAAPMAITDARRTLW
jgi:hypothetical protein